VDKTATPPKPYSCTVKLLMAGNAGAGKSSLMLCYAGEDFHPLHIQTIGIDFKNVAVDVNGEAVNVQLWVRFI
jgi:GTPase SAR1 family protein